MIYSRYRHLAIEGSKPPPTEAQLRAIETLLEATLPESFVEFLRVANGGSIEYMIDVPMSNGKTEQLSFSEFSRVGFGRSHRDATVGNCRASEVVVWSEGKIILLFLNSHS
jgi:hypothetical protein